MSLYLEIGHDCLDGNNTKVFQRISTWKWKISYLKSLIREIRLEKRYSKMMGFKFYFLLGIKV